MKHGHEIGGDTESGQYCPKIVAAPFLAGRYLKLSVFCCCVSPDRRETRPFFKRGRFVAENWMVMTRPD